MSRFDAILDKIDAAGWFPTRLSKEASEALELPPLPPSPHLSDLDKLGVLWVCIFLTYCRRFLGRLQTSEADKRSDEIETMSILAVNCLLHQLGAEKRTAGRAEPITGEDYCRWADEFQRWWQERLKPSRICLESAGSGTAASSVEPALTLARVDRGYVLVDYEAIRQDFGRGLAMHAEGSLRPKEIRQVTDSDLHDFLKFLRHSEIGILDKRGNLRFHAPGIKTALDAMIGRVSMKQMDCPTERSGEQSATSPQATEEPLVQREAALGLEADLRALPAEVMDMVKEVLDVQLAQDVLDAVHAASCQEDPARQAAVLHKAWSGSISRARLAQVFGTSPDKIRTAEEKLG